MDTIKNRPTVSKALEAIENGDRELINTFMENSIYHIDLEKIRPVFERLAFHPDTSNEEVIALHAKFGSLRKLADIRERNRQTSRR
jgi:uncharacterized membrane protein YvbJ